MERRLRFHNAVTGRLISPKRVELDEALPMTSTMVRVVVEPIEEGPTNSYQEVISLIRRRQEAREHRPPTKDEVDQFLIKERNGWE